MTLTNNETAGRVIARAGEVLVVDADSASHRTWTDDGEAALQGAEAITDVPDQGMADASSAPVVAGDVVFLIDDGAGWASAAAGDEHELEKGRSAPAVDLSFPDGREKAAATPVAGFTADEFSPHSEFIILSAELLQDDFNYVSQEARWSQFAQGISLGYFPADEEELANGQYYVYDIVEDDSGEFSIYSTSGLLFSGK